MGSTFSGIETAKRGLAAHQQALQTTGHNISNADNKHYSRQKVNFNAMQPLYNPSLNRANGPGMIGQGVQIENIERVRDHFVDDRIMASSQERSYWAVRERYLSQVEIIYNEPSETAIRANMDKFWQSWQELSQFPEEVSHREVVKTRAQELIYNVKNTYAKIHDLQEQADAEIQQTVARLNSIGSEIRDLNEKILKSQTAGDNPNDLLDRRDMLMAKLGDIADVSVSRTDKDESMVYIGGEIFVQGEVFNKVTTKPSASKEGFSEISWEHNNKEVVLKSGSLFSLKEMRDIDLREQVNKIDLMAINLSDIVNEVHRNGFSLTKETNLDFFSIRDRATNLNGNIDLNLDGQQDTSAIFRVTGKNIVIAERPVGVDGVLTFFKKDDGSSKVQISYKAEETLDQIIKRINRSDAGVVAYVNHQGNLSLKGTIAEDDWHTNFMLKHIEDSGELLVGFAGILQNSGEAGAFGYRRTDDIQKFQVGGQNITLTPATHPAGDFKLSREIQENVNLIATATGKDIGGSGDVNESNGTKDGSIALKIAQALRHDNTMVGDHANPEEFYNALIAKLGSEGREAKDKIESQTEIMKNLENLRQSVMGVSLDEEMANMVQFQHAYNASARVLQTMNEILDQIINRLI